jgi:hypothetical protein
MIGPGHAFARTDRPETNGGGSLGRISISTTLNVGVSQLRLMPVFVGREDNPALRERWRDGTFV